MAQHKRAWHPQGYTGPGLKEQQFWNLTVDPRKGVKVL